MNLADPDCARAIGMGLGQTFHINQPEALAAETIQATGKIIAIDQNQRTVTLQFEDGDTETFTARPDTDLSRLKLGDREVIRVTEMIAIWVERQ